MSDSINVSDIMLAFNIEQDDFNNIKSIIQTIPQINDYFSNIHHFIILSSLIFIFNNNINGSIVELGCCPGQITIRISKILELYNYDKTYHVYDTFNDIPSSSNYELNINSDFNIPNYSCPISKYTHFLENFNIHKSPSIHQGTFHLINKDLYPLHISFAIFDSCLYHSNLTSFNIIWKKLELNGIIIIINYDNPLYFGVKDSCLQFFNTINNDISSIYTYNILYQNYNIMVITKILKNNNNTINTQNIKII